MAGSFEKGMSPYLPEQNRQTVGGIAMVSQVLKGVYRGNTGTLKGRVMGELLGQTVDCPALGSISRMKCVKNRELPFAATNPQRVRLYKACRDNCSHSGQQND